MSVEDKTLEIHNLFLSFDDPMDKYIQIIEFGKKNNGLKNIDKNENTRIYGCTSMAWVKTKKMNNQYMIKTDSDTFIVKGLLSILEFILNGASKIEIENSKIENILLNIGLDNSITSQRTNGFLSAVEQIKKQIKLL
jgi:cysteine desulfuration protein SufE